MKTNNSNEIETQKERISALSKMLIKSFNYAEVDPDSFLLNARKTTETICKFIFNKEVGEDGRKKMMLSDYGRELVSKKIIPERIGIIIGTIQTYGNYGAHAQDDFSEASKDWIAPCQSALASLSNWFFLEYLKANIPNELSQPLLDYSDESINNGIKSPNRKRRVLIASISTVLLIIIGIVVFKTIGGDKSTANLVENNTTINNSDNVLTDGAIKQNVDIKQYVSGTIEKAPNARRIAILYFDNSSEEPELKGLAKGLTDMMITDLSKYYMLQVVERDKLDNILKEQKLSNSKSFDQSTAIKIGKLLGAECILAGSYFEILDNLRIDARLIDIETGKIISSEGINGASNDFFNLEKQLVGKIISGLEVNLKDEEKGYLNTSSYKNFSVKTGLKFSKGLDYLDEGNYAKAKELIEDILEENPGFEPAIQALHQVEI